MDAIAKNNRWKLLIIDDDEDDYHLIRAMLPDAQMQYSLKWVTTFDTGLAELQSPLQTESYDAVIVDYDLGPHTGVELIRTANEQGYPGAFILYTGRGSREIDLEAMQAGASMYLTKGETSALMLERGIRYAIERKQYEVALRKSESQYRELVQDANSAIVRWSRDGTITFFNEYAQKLFGWPGDEAIGKHVSMLVPEHESTGADLTGLAQDLVEKPEHYEYFENENICRDGRRVWMSWTNRPILDEHGQVAEILAVGSDMSERRKAEELLRESERQQRELAKSLEMDITERKRAQDQLREAHQAVAQSEERKSFLLKLSDILNPLSDAVEIQAVVTQTAMSYFNTDRSYYCEIDGDLVTIRRDACLPGLPAVAGLYSMENMPIFKAISEHGLPIVVQDVRTTDQVDEVLRQLCVEMKIIAYINVPVIKNGQLTGSFCLTQSTPRSWSDIEVDLTAEIAERTWAAVERARAEAALGESEERYRELVQYAPAGIYEVDFRSRRFTSVNDAMCRVTGFSREELLQMDPFEILDEPSQRLFQARIKQWLSGERPDDNVEYRLLTKDGREIYAVLNITFTRDAKGQPLGATVIAHDITERKRAEIQLKEQSEAIQEYSRKLEQSNQELQDFAFIASHDLQEPLRKMETFAQILVKSAGPNLGEKERDYLERMQSAAQRLNRMIQDLLALSRVSIQAKPFETVNLNQVAKSVVDDLAVLLRQTGGQVEIRDLPTLQADPTQMHQLLLNLIGNGLKFHQGDVPPLVQVYARLHSDQQVEICIEDNGIGFNMEHAGQLFQPFHRLHGHSEYQGTGIGLSICRKIVERHGGTITAESEPCKGSTFMIRLPTG